MKRIMATLALCLALLTLLGCGQTSTNGATETPQTAAQQTDAPVTGDKKAMAQSCEGQTVDALFALVGQPDSSEYAPSCLNPGQGEDGVLYYDGFVVYTYKEGSTETVEYVE